MATKNYFTEGSHWSKQILFPPHIPIKTQQFSKHTNFHFQTKVTTTHFLKRSLLKYPHLVF